MTYKFDKGNILSPCELFIGVMGCCAIW